MVDEDGLGGVTSNPAIFEKAITGSTDYTEALFELQRTRAWTRWRFMSAWPIKDIQDAADVLRPVYERTKRRDGYVSLEVSPFLAKDTRRHHQGRPPAVESRQPAEPDGEDSRHRRGHPGNRAGASARASTSMSRCCSRRTCMRRSPGHTSPGFRNGRLRAAKSAGWPAWPVSSSAGSTAWSTPSLKARLKAAGDARERALLAQPDGQGRHRQREARPISSIRASSRAPAGNRWRQLGAQTQRVLWASTSTKDPSYSDVLYVEELIGPDTVNTIPPATFDAFRDHGKPRASLEADLDAAQDVMETLEAVGISMKQVTDELVTQAVKLFAEPFDKLLNSVDAEMQVAYRPMRWTRRLIACPPTSQSQVQAAIEDWKMAGKVRRLWASRRVAVDRRG